MELIHPLFKWLHLIAGITWIGLLYFFNWINGHFAATLDGDTKKKVVPELMPRALYWFRWGAAWTWVTGVVMAVITVAFGVTGYSLPWDQVGYWAVKIVSGVPAAIPIIGDFMVELLRGGESVGQSTLTRFYSLHTFVLPWSLAVFMLMHFLMIRKQGISGPL